MATDKRNTILQVNRVAKTALEVFDDILNKEHLDRQDLQLIIEKIKVYEDHLEIQLKADIDAILHAGMLPAEEPEPVALMPGEQLDVTITAKPFLYAPVQAGDVVGHALFSVDGQPVADVTLTAASDVAAVKGKPSFFSRLFGG